MSLGKQYMSYTYLYLWQPSTLGHPLFLVPSLLPVYEKSSTSDGFAMAITLQKLGQWHHGGIQLGIASSPLDPARRP